MTKKYIDADLTQEKLRELCKKYNINFDVNHTDSFGGSLANLIDGLPPANVQEVRHGYYKSPSEFSECECSMCGRPSKILFGILPLYCPWCGTRMDGDKNDR